MTANSAKDKNRMRRFSLKELEIACIEAHMSGRVYATGGEKATPGDEHWNMFDRALRAVRIHRAMKRRESRAR